MHIGPVRDTTLPLPALTRAVAGKAAYLTIRDLFQEPTTDRFVAIMHGDEERRTPGNAVAVSGDKPFRGLSQYGTGFLSRFECAQCPAPILESLSFVDSPGVLSGQKQTIGRSYDFVSVIKWFAEKSDLILLLFDAHKLDISDEFKRTLEAMKGQVTLTPCGFDAQRPWYRVEPPDSFCLSLCLMHLPNGVSAERSLSALSSVAALNFPPVLSGTMKRFE